MHENYKFKFSALMSLRSRDYVQAKALALVVIRARSVRPPLGTWE